MPCNNLYIRNYTQVKGNLRAIRLDDGLRQRNHRHGGDTALTISCYHIKSNTCIRDGTPLSMCIWNIVFRVIFALLFLHFFIWNFHKFAETKLCLKRNKLRKLEFAQSWIFSHWWGKRGENKRGGRVVYFSVYSIINFF